MPNLLNDIQDNGTLISHNHTPLIAHTATDILTTLTGLYGSSHGQPISNAFGFYNPDGSTSFRSSVEYWTSTTLRASTKALESGDATGDTVYTTTINALGDLGKARDQLVATMQRVLDTTGPQEDGSPRDRRRVAQQRRTAREPGHDPAPAGLGAGR